MIRFFVTIVMPLRFDFPASASALAAAFLLAALAGLDVLAAAFLLVAFLLVDFFAATFLLAAFFAVAFEPDAFLALAAFAPDAAGAFVVALAADFLDTAFFAAGFLVVLAFDAAGAFLVLPASDEPVVAAARCAGAFFAPVFFAVRGLALEAFFFEAFFAAGEADEAALPAAVLAFGVVDDFFADPFESAAFRVFAFFVVVAAFFAKMLVLGAMPRLVARHKLATMGMKVKAFGLFLVISEAGIAIWPSVGSARHRISHLFGK